MLTRFSKRTVLLWTLLLIAALALAACGGGAQEPAAPADEETTAGEETDAGEVSEPVEEEGEAGEGEEAAAGGPIKVGAIFDLTGATSDVGTPYAEGVRDYVAWLNANGGINGRPIELVRRIMATRLIGRSSFIASTRIRRTWSSSKAGAQATRRRCAAVLPRTKFLSCRLPTRLL